MAKQMGLPIDRLVTTNSNDILTRTLASGQHGCKRSAQSPSMDIQVSSNFERRFSNHMAGTRTVRRLMAELRHRKGFPSSQARLKPFAPNSTRLASPRPKPNRDRPSWQEVISHRPAHRRRKARAGLGRSTSASPLVARHRASRQIPDAIARATGIRPDLPSPSRSFQRKRDLRYCLTRMKSSVSFIARATAAKRAAS